MGRRERDKMKIIEDMIFEDVRNQNRLCAKKKGVKKQVEPVCESKAMSTEEELLYLRAELKQTKQCLSAHESFTDEVVYAMEKVDWNNSRIKVAHENLLDTLNNQTNMLTQEG